MLSSTVTVKGQVVIPSSLRKKFRIGKGTRILFYEQDGEIRLLPLTPDSIDTNIGFLQTRGKLLRALRKEKKSEREL
jgi:AbrB family looped-hinge helix DNA binding protein